MYEARYWGILYISLYNPTCASRIHACHLLALGYPTNLLQCPEWTAWALTGFMLSCLECMHACMYVYPFTQRRAVLLCSYKRHSNLKDSGFWRQLLSYIVTAWIPWCRTLFMFLAMYNMALLKLSYITWQWYYCTSPLTERSWSPLLSPPCLRY